MIVIAKNYGQLGNRLFLFSHFIAAAAEYRVSVANPCFAEYADLFDSTRNDLWCRFDGSDGDPTNRRNAVGATDTPPSPAARRRLASVVQAISKTLHLSRMRNWPCHVVTTKRWEEGDYYDLGTDEFRKLARGNRHFLARGWMFRSEPLFEKHATLIRQFFAITRQHRRAVDAKIAECRRDTDLLVGVHVRHGDYRKFLGGKYFYTLEQYADQMRSVADRIHDRRVTFLVCGNAEMSARDFPGLRVQFGPGHMVQDMYSLAETDWMFGPPSTFTGWAAFVGDRARVELETATQVIDAEGITAAAFDSPATRAA